MLGDTPTAAARARSDEPAACTTARSSSSVGCSAALLSRLVVAFRRARHVITEIERTRQAARAIRAGDWAATGQLMDASHASLRDDFEVSCAELDLVVELAQAIGESGGIIGCRMTGGGFGGCAVSLVRVEAIPQITTQIAAAYRKKTGLEPTIFSSRPAGGARVLS